ncbi:oxidoreductase [Dorcoceras hygrometricum]|uniref:Oxidoreductase n=1 Tax=Dorcoceras hygrometricum TaxID=472368 RepID=A0A2Z7B5Z0_9LAMI|nr:oxidoreductase [Dorcoceras hygrometricum]
MRDIGPVELLFMYYELMDPCVHGMVKWQHRDMTYRDPEIEHAEPLDSLGLNGADDDPTEFTPTGGEDIRSPVAAVPRDRSDVILRDDTLFLVCWF